MPEGPEVKIMSEMANRIASGRKIIDIKFLSGKFSRREVGEVFVGKVVGVRCFGKFCWFELEGGETNIGISFGMSGAFRSRFEKHCHIQFVFEGEGEELWYYDPRNFGNISFLTRSGLNKVIASLGIDLLSSEGREREAVELMRGRGGKKNICVALMDQSIWSGVGNYLKSECLYRASISPFATVDQISNEKLGELWRAVFSLAQASYKARGASLYTFRDLEGEEGKFQDLLMIYRKKVDPWGRKVSHAETPDKRTTWFVAVE